VERLRSAEHLKHTGLASTAEMRGPYVLDAQAGYARSYGVVVPVVVPVVLPVVEPVVVVPVVVEPVVVPVVVVPVVEPVVVAPVVVPVGVVPAVVPVLVSVVVLPEVLPDVPSVVAQALMKVREAKSAAPTSKESWLRFIR